MISSEQLLTNQWEKKIKKAQHLHCPHREHKHTGHTLKIFWKSSDMASKMGKISNNFKEL